MSDVEMGNDNLRSSIEIVPLILAHQGEIQLAVKLDGVVIDSMRCADTPDCITETAYDLTRHALALGRAIMRGQVQALQEFNNPGGLKIVEDVPGIEETEEVT